MAGVAFSRPGFDEVFEERLRESMVFVSAGRKYGWDSARIVRSCGAWKSASAICGSMASSAINLYVVISQSSLFVYVEASNE